MWCDEGVGGVRGDHSRYSDASCMCVCLTDVPSGRIYLARSAASSITICLCMFVYPLCIMGMDPEYSSFALHASDVS